MAIQWEPDAMEQMYALYDKMLETKLGPAVKAEVQRQAPVDLGNLKEGVTYEVDRAKHTLYVNAYGDPKREPENRKYYAYYVEMGHEIVVYGYRTGRHQAPNPFMRRALYRRYEGF